MRLKLQYRRYRLPLRVPVRTAHQAWTEREGIIVRVEADDGAAGYGEVAPIPAFGTETVDEAEAALRALGEWCDADSLAQMPVRLGCVRSAFETALGAGDAGPSEPVGSDYRAVAALLPAGRGAAAQARTMADAGFRVFKWKVGVGDIADELALLDDVCAAIPSGAKLRLDANGAWDRRKAERWLERCAERPIEYVEQPCFAGAGASPSERRKADDLLLGLAGDFPTPIALDESVISDADAGRWLADGWPGWYVIKPTLLGSPGRLLGQLAAAKAAVVFSSALETRVGARAALTTAFRWRGEAKALGFGVWPLFTDSRFDGPAAAPFIRWDDVQRLDPSGVWNALT